MCDLCRGEINPAELQAARDWENRASKILKREIAAGLVMGMLSGDTPEVAIIALYRSFQKFVESPDVAPYNVTAENFPTTLPTRGQRLN